MKKLLLSLIAVTAFAVVAQQKIMRIHYADGTSETHPVSDVTKITFEEKGDDPEPVDERVVDLGLSVCWASYNIGADKPEGYGNFYAYGEIEPKTDYSFDTYQWRNPDYDEYYDQLDEWEYYYKLGATFTGTNYDVAHVKWGGDWRVPTKEEWSELFNKCEVTWTAINGVTGAKITSKTNGNSIFLPAAGNMVGTSHTHDQTGCFYWTSTECIQSDITQECRNYRANIDANNHSADGYDYPDVGFNIRAVCGPVPVETLPDVVKPTEADMIDLGLPSGTKWAAFNVGASKPSSNGLFLCWAEVTEKQYSHTYNYKYYDPLADDYVFVAEQIANTEYDAAHVLWGDGWRMPTMAEMQELIDNCTWTADTYGYKVVGPNGNSIYLPASGMMTYKGAPRSSYNPGYYWCSDADMRTNSQGQPMKTTAGALRFTRGGGNVIGSPQVTYASRAAGVQIRPVHD